MRTLTPRVITLGVLAVGAVVAVGLPWAVTSYQASQFAYVLIFAIALLGLVVLTGNSGQISLGHGAFMAVGAFVTAIGTSRYGIAYAATIPLAALLCGVLGFLIGLPALRLEGIYLALATFALGVGAPDILRKPAAITGGVKGIILPPVSSPVGFLDDNQFFYYLSLAVALVVFVVVWNLLRGRTGRAWRAIRDSELAARSAGINIAVYKTLAFSISAACAGVAGSLYALANSFVAADGFQVQLSIQLLVGAIIGGIGFLEGAVIGGLIAYFLPIYSQQLLLGINKSIANAAPGATQGVLLLVIMFFARDGIAGLLRLSYLRLRARRVGRRQAEVEAGAGGPAV